MNSFSTRDKVPYVEVSVDTVYIRTNVTKSENQGTIGWEYDEEQISKDEFIERLQQENTNMRTDLNNAVMELSMLIAMGGSI